MPKRNQSLDNRLKELAALHRLELGDDYLAHCAAAREWLAQVLAAAGGGELCVFAYASLTWKPSFKPTFVSRGRLHGYSRLPCIYSTTYRGTRRRPGLVAGLAPGGSVTGLIQGLGRRRRARELTKLFNREMFQGVYYPRIVGVRPLDAPGEPRACLAFVANPYSPAYAGRLPAARVAKIVATASGRMGPCRDYWAETAAKLAAHGIACGQAPLRAPR